MFSRDYYIAGIFSVVVMVRRSTGGKRSGGRSGGWRRSAGNHGYYILTEPSDSEVTYVGRRGGWERQRDADYN